MTRPKTRERTNRSIVAKLDDIDIVANALDDLEIETQIKSSALHLGQTARGPITSNIGPDINPTGRIPSVANRNVGSTEEQQHSALSYHAEWYIRYAQYNRRYLRRKERVAAVRLRLRDERDYMSNQERWRLEDLETLYTEMLGAERGITAAALTNQNQTCLQGVKRVQSALERIQADDVAIRKQQRVLSRLEELLVNAEFRLDKVQNSMMKAANKCIERSGVDAQEFDDLISKSTETSIRPNPQRQKSQTPAVVERYFEAKGNKSIMFERLMEIEFEYKEEMDRRAFARDRGEPLEKKAAALVDENHERELRLGNRDYEVAFAECAKAEMACQDAGYNPDDFRNEVSDNGEEDDEEEDAKISARPELGAVSVTLTTLASVLGHTDTIGPNPEDATGLQTTTISIGTERRLGASDVETTSKKSNIVRWMEDMEENEPPRMHRRSPSNQVGDDMTIESQTPTVAVPISDDDRGGGYGHSHALPEPYHRESIYDDSHRMDPQRLKHDSKMIGSLRQSQARLDSPREALYIQSMDEKVPEQISTVNGEPSPMVNNGHETSQVHSIRVGQSFAGQPIDGSDTDESMATAKGELADLPSDVQLPEQQIMEQTIAQSISDGLPADRMTSSAS